MSRVIFSGSAGPRISRCISSGLFGVVRSSSDAADVGSCGHMHMRQRGLLGIDEAMRLLPELFAQYGLSDRDSSLLAARLRKFSFIPPPASVSEVALALFPSSVGAERARRVIGGKGSYPDLPPDAITPTQIDLMYSEPEPLDWRDKKHPKCPRGSTLIVGDYKFGSDSHVDPVERNVQLKIAAVAGAIWTGADSVLPAIIYPDDGEGEWDVPKDASGMIVAWDSERIETEYQSILALHQRRVDAALAIASGAPPEVHEGSWCSFCESQDSCPAKLALVRAVVDPDAPATLAPVGLTEEQAARLVVLRIAAERFAERARKALEMYVNVHEEAIDVGDGLKWGPVVVPISKVDPKRALPVLQEELGDYWTSTLSISKDAIEEAVREKHEAEGVKRKKAEATRKIFAKLIESEAMPKVEQLQYRLHRPTLVLAPQKLEDKLRASVDEGEIEEGDAP